MLKRLAVATCAAGAIAIAGATTALATPSPNGPGQPNASCEEAPSGPPGFDTTGFAVAEDRYAGNGPSADHANSPYAVSQYDVACYQLSTH